MHQKITTSSSEAQAFYDQGLTLLHHYSFIDAARSFRQALRSDPECAMCWMGLARAEQGLERADATAAAIAKAESLSPKASLKERTFIALRAQQIEAQAAPSGEEGKKHDAYKTALDKALGTYPDDAELWIIRGNAEEAGPWGRGQFGRAASIAFYETALVRSPGHLGAHHYLVHSFENIAHHAEAADHAKIYAGPSPASRTRSTCTATSCPASAAGTRPSRSSRRPTRSRRRTRRRKTSAPATTGTTSTTCSFWATRTCGSSASTTRRRRFAAPSIRPLRLPYRGTPQASLAEFYLLRGQPEQALAVARALQVDTRTPATRVVATAVEGEALLALGRTEDARKAAERAQKALDAARVALGREARISTGSCAPYIEQLETEIALHGEDPSAAEASIRKVADELSTESALRRLGRGSLPARPHRGRRAPRRTHHRSPPTSKPKMKVIDPDYVPGSISGRARRRKLEGVPDGARDSRSSADPARGGIRSRSRSTPPGA